MQCHARSTGVIGDHAGIYGARHGLHLGQDFTERPGATPVYVQLADFIAAAVERGDLAPGTKLPAERDLAELVGHSPETVAKARRLLVERGIAESAVGRGTFIRGTPPGAITAHRGASGDR